MSFRVIASRNTTRPEVQPTAKMDVSKLPSVTVDGMDLDLISKPLKIGHFISQYVGLIGCRVRCRR